MSQALEADRRLSSLGRLFGESGLARLRASKVVVVGIGGVGSWAAEALARSGVGRLELIDMDHVAESNINRQVHALESTIGAAKVEAMRQRIADISSHCQVSTLEEFAQPENVEVIIDPSADFVIDATDQVKAKAALCNLARQRQQGLVVCGAAGGRLDPLMLTRDDIAVVKGDALIASLRARLRREYGFPKGSVLIKGKASVQTFKLSAIYSKENMAIATNPPDASPGDLASAGSPLACAGYGSIITVTAAMGLAAASFAMREILCKPGS